MSFSDAVTTCMQKYATFSGRAARPEYWWFVLFTWVLSIVAAFVDNAAGLTFSAVGSLGFVGVLVDLAVFLPSLAVGARRLHDIGRSGWWLLFALVPCAGLILLVVFFCLPGQREPNAYGAPPA